MSLAKYLFVISLFVGLVPAQGYGEESKPRVLLITGSGPDLEHGQKYPPWVHEFQNEKVVEILSDSVLVDVTTDLAVLNDTSLKAYDLVISNSLFLTPTKPQLAALKKFVTRGKALLTLHSGLLSFLNADYYEEMMGGIFIGGPSTEPETFKVITENSEFWFYDYHFRPSERHPISMVVDDFTTTDELYYFQPNSRHIKVIARAENHPVMWEHSWKKGRVMSLVLGHDMRAKESAGYQALLKNGVRWLVGYPMLQKLPEVRFDSHNKQIKNFVNLNQFASEKNASRLTFSIMENTSQDLVELHIDKQGILALELKKDEGTATVTIQATNHAGLKTHTTFNLSVDAERKGNLSGYYGVQAFASSAENRNDVQNPESLIDGNLETRWASASVDPSWVIIDLGKTCRFSQVVLHWESSFGAAYDIEIANNPDEAWRNVFSEKKGDGNIDDIVFPPVEARYLRLLGKQRAVPRWGYSLYEIEIYNP